ncbi:MAG: response regulator transcription factor [Rhizobiales bacterium]|nr:response regulator transcription factor [Hyphomicrobiales bacterium]
MPRNAADENILHDFRIILVEDDHDLRQSIADYLRLRKIHVTEAASGIALYKALRQESYDIAVMDVNLPDVSGFELARDIAPQGEMGIIMLTARAGRDDRVRGYAEGADLYLTKPVDSEELALAIVNLGHRIRRARAQPVGEQAALAVTSEDAPWLLDRQSQVLRSSGGAFARLSARETILLDYMARHPDKTVSRDEISALFGHAEPAPESRRIDAAFARLRSKLKAEGMDLPVRVVHGAGLRLVKTIRVV